MRIFGREPALILTLVATIIRFIGAFFIDLNTDQQAVLNALATAGMGLLVAKVTHNGLPAAILGFAQALIALALGFGINVSADNQAVIMSLVGAAVAMFIRTQVTAPVRPNEVTT